MIPVVSAMLFKEKAKPAVGDQKTMQEVERAIHMPREFSFNIPASSATPAKGTAI